MPQKTARPATWDSRPGLDDFSRAADKSGLAIPQIAELRQAADRRLRRQRQVERLCETPRLVFELIEEVRRHHPGIAPDLDRRLGRFAEIDLSVLRALGGDRFAASPMRQVERAGAR